MGIKKKLLIAFIAMSLAQTLIISAVYYFVASDLVKGSERKEKTTHMQDLAAEINTLIQSVQLFGIQCHLDSGLTEPVRQYESASKSQRYELRFGIRMAITSHMQDLDAVKAVTVYTPYGSVFSATANSFVSKQDPAAYYQMRAAVDGKNGYTWYCNDGVVSYLRVITSTDARPDVWGILQVDLKPTAITALFPSQSDTKIGDYSLTTSDGTVFASTNEAVGLDAQMLRDGSFTAEIGADAYMVTSARLTSIPWRVTNFVPMQELLWPILQTLRNCILISLGTIVIFAGVAAFLAIRIATPIRRLSEEMKKVTEDNLCVHYLPDGKDEIGALGRSYAGMIRRLNDSIAQIYTEQAAKRKAELKALEYQINPHFLYNTFSLLVWQIDAGEQEAAINTVSALSNMFSVSIREDSGIIPVEEELSYAKSYLEIQSKRFADRFTAEFIIQDNLRGLYTPKMVLQPIIENAVAHGIVKNKVVNGRISISLQTFADGVEFLVKDSGRALSREDADRLNRKLRHTEANASDGGIGIQNVHDRIVLKYGAAYGVTVTLDEDGTCVKIRIPEIKGE